MLTVIETLSLAGSRTKQNDDLHGTSGQWAWVIDGATDLHDAPLTPAASDAAWIAEQLNVNLHALAGRDGRSPLALVQAVAEDAAGAFVDLAGPLNQRPAWQWPFASVLIVRETAAGLEGADFGDCRLFALDAQGAAHALGGPPAAADGEAAAARKALDAGGTGALLDRSAVLEGLRDARSRSNLNPQAALFGVAPGLTAAGRTVRLDLARPAHVLLASDGFAALVDRYGALSPGGLVQAALDRGLAALGVELRAIEAADADGQRHPRFKPSDDATAVLLRLT